MCWAEVASPWIPGKASDEAVGQEVLHPEARLFAGDPLGHEPRRDGRQENAVAEVPGGDEQPLEAGPRAEYRQAVRRPWPEAAPHPSDRQLAQRGHELDGCAKQTGDPPGGGGAPKSPAPRGGADPP